MGFFFSNQQDTKNKIPIKTAQQLQCRVCPLARCGSLNSNMEAVGSSNPFIYVLGEAPGNVEDNEGEHFVSKAGVYLKKQIPRDLKNEVRYNYVVRTKPPAERSPDEIEIECCRPSIITDIEETKPLVIIGAGAIPLKWAIGEAGISKWRGRLFSIKIGKHICWFYPVFDPKYVIGKRKKNRRTNQDIFTEYDQTFEQDLKWLWKNIDNLKYPTNDEFQQEGFLEGTKISKGLKSEKELKKVFSWMDEIEKLKVIGIDIETNCLRPFEDDSKIITVAIGTKDICYSFPIEYYNAWDSDQLNRLNARFKQFLLNSGIKIAHNLKFELEWFAIKYGVEILYNTEWGDTMAQSYVLDERFGMHSLDYKIRINFGFWLKDLSNLNRAKMTSYSLEKILPYNALDTKYTHKLYEAQHKALDKALKGVYERLIKASITLTHMQIRGLKVDMKARDELNTEATKELRKIVRQLRKMDEIKLFERRFKEFKPSSPAQVLTMLKDIYGFSDEIKDEKGKQTSDESVLVKIDNEFTKHILNYRAIEKKQTTYLEPLVKNVFSDNYIHTNFNPYRTSTGRLCVAKGTLVQTLRFFADNPRGIPIEEIKVGDYVYCFDDNLEPDLKKVYWADKTGTKKVMRIHWQDVFDKKTGYLDVTCNHPIRLINGNFIRADELKNDTLVLAMHLNKTKKYTITKIEWLDGLVDVYDMGVEDFHNFIANDLCVSNSSSNPNMQNWPNRKGKDIRKIISAPKDKIMVCADYGQIEARLIGAASQDATFCEALWDDYDVHLEWAKKISDLFPSIFERELYEGLTKKQALKKFRGYVKNQWVFPAFYGSSAYSISKSMQLQLNKVLELFEEFWKTFEGVKEWQKWVMRFYRKNGYVETLTGRRRRNPLSYNEAVNSVIQGTSSDLCVNAMIELDRKGVEVVLNVHDDITSYVLEDELEKTVEIIAETMCSLRYKWLNIPIAAEITCGFDWYNQEEIDTYLSTEFINVNRRPLEIGYYQKTL